MRALTCGEIDVTVSWSKTRVTSGGEPLTIGSVRYWTEQLLTKRRAVDFCRVSASLCRTV
ncbi:hypothetical protein DPM19_29590 [Actinomadura craniellae]|uniref:Uncharacterized protein n=1 Tax=Actinomadura craniellae TaxID=2231787 RepID=A0A365GXA4_9ACTN|nr:hypothetical protein DPM19_29590 [Actinomadura craniellae]